ncbi:hypothetical protein K440DRAFT_27761 [Wilcoxina mikolae CBS 423.85]|nr:hypothetical protein K440DRAFT_27761 [Wilcoxina mikolae CBS 423.85]
MYTFMNAMKFTSWYGYNFRCPHLEAHTIFGLVPQCFNALFTHFFSTQLTQFSSHLVYISSCKCMVFIRLQIWSPSLPSTVT